MSYRNPTMIPPADPMAFSRGFEQAFAQQQSAFQADLEERKKLAQEADEALANAYAMADIGPINGIDNKFNQALQDSLNKIIDDGDFANASKADQVKMLQDLRLKKAAFGRIGEIMSVDTQDWDLRNDPKLSAFRKAVLSGEDFKIDSSGLDFKINGSFGTITLDDIANTRIINKAPYEEKLDQINGDFKERYGKLVLTAYKEGKSEQEIQVLKQTLKSSYGSLLKSQDPDFKKYMQYNVAETDDENQMIENMFDQIDADVLDPSLIYKRPVEKAKEDIRTKSQIIKDQTAEQRVKSLDSLGFLFDTTSAGKDYDYHKDTKFVNNMAALGLSVEPTLSPGKEKGFTIKDQVTNNSINIYPQKQTINQTKQIIKSLISSQSTKPVLPK